MREISYWLLCGTDFCLFIYSFSCLCKQSSKSFSTRLLGAMLLILAWYVFMSLLILSGNLIRYAFLFRVGVPFYYLLIPLLYCYLKSSYEQKTNFTWYDWLHFIPALLCFIDLYPYLFLMPLKAKRMEMELYLKNPMEVVAIGRGMVPAATHYYLRGLQGIIYTFLSCKIFFSKCAVNQKCNIKFKEAKMISALMNILFAGNTIMCLAILRKGNWFSFYQMNSIFDYTILLMLLGLVTLCVYIYNTPFIFNDYEFSSFSTPGLFTGHVVEEVISFPEHHEAPADLKHYNAELEKLENLMLKFQAFRRKGLTLQDIAIELGIASYVLSAILNNHYHQHFNDYVNTYRISYVIERIRSDKDWKKLSIEGLADEAGFASRTPFYAAFKKHTGLTPSAYIQQHRV